MTDPVTALLITLSFFILLAAVRFFKTLDGDVVSAWQTPMIAGVISGALLRVLNLSHPVAIGVILTVAALYIRLTGHETEPVDGMMFGACAGAAAAVPLIIRSELPCSEFTHCVLAGCVAGYGVTLAGIRSRPYVIDVMTALVAIGAAYVPGNCTIAMIVAAVIPLIVVIAVFRQWPDVRAELSHEASMGFMPDTDVRRTAHPLLRLGSGGWTDAKAHREFVRLANQIALRKRQQRNRPDEIARLYQLEIIKLRMQLEAMTKINRHSGESDEVASDTMAHSK